MTRVILETGVSIAYTKQAASDSLQRGEFPLSMQLLYATPGFSPEEIGLGEDAILAWSEVAELVACYTDLGITPEMQTRLAQYGLAGLLIEHRNISTEP
jgi:hypothetical protein